MATQSPFRSAAALLAVLAIAGWASQARGQQDTPSERTSRLVTERDVEERLAEATRLEVRDIPLADALQMISREHDLPIFLNRRALLDVGVDPSSLITADYRNLTLGTALELMLRDLDLTYVVGDGALLVTTPEEEEMRLVTRVYSVQDLVHVYDWMVPPETQQTQGDRTDFDTLISLVAALVAPDSWDAVGGPGTVQPLPPDLLIVTQTQAAHEELGNLLDALRRLPNAAEQPGLGPEDRKELLLLTGWMGPIGAVSETYMEIENALERPHFLQAVDVPLRDLVGEIERRHNIPVELDHRALQDVGIDADMPITANYHDVPLREGLELLLDEYGLSYLIDDEVLLITSEEAAEQRLSLRVYPVIDLVLLRSEEEGWLPMDFDSLAQVVMTSVDQDSWEMVGGPGSLQAFPLKAALVVHQTQRTHEKIASLLGQMRQHRFAAGAPNLPLRSAREEVVTQAYPLATGELSDEHQEALRSLILRTVRPDSWGTQGARFITFLPGTIVVHHRPDVQAEVRELLVRLGVVQRHVMGGGLGGGFGGGGFGGGGF